MCILDIGDIHSDKFCDQLMARRWSSTKLGVKNGLNEEEERVNIDRTLAYMSKAWVHLFFLNVDGLYIGSRDLACGQHWCGWNVEFVEEA